MSTQVTVIGSIGGALERRTTTRDDPYARFRLASTDRRTDERGAWIDGNTNWYEVQVYGALGENALASLGKGERVVVHGELTVREWTAQDGTRRTTTQIRANAVGHDLLFGTTQFRRTPRQAPSQQAAAEPAVPAGQAAAVDRSTTWPQPLAPGAAPAAAGELVGAGAVDDTPF